MVPLAMFGTGIDVEEAGIVWVVLFDPGDERLLVIESMVLAFQSKNSYLTTIPATVSYLGSLAH